MPQSWADTWTKVPPPSEPRAIEFMSGWAIVLRAEPKAKSKESNKMLFRMFLSFNFSVLLRAAVPSSHFHLYCPIDCQALGLGGLPG